MMEVECLDHTDVNVRYDTGRRRMSFAAKCKLSLTNTVFSKRKCGLSHTHNDTSPNEGERIDYIITRQAHRPRLHSLVLVSHPSLPAGADPNHNI